MDENISEIVDSLEFLVDDLPSKPKQKLQEIIDSLNTLDDEFETNELMKIQDDLEVVSNMANVDSFSRNEIINVLTLIETLI